MFHLGYSVCEEIEIFRGASNLVCPLFSALIHLLYVYIVLVSVYSFIYLFIYRSIHWFLWFFSCGGEFFLDQTDIGRIVSSAYFECSNCTLCLEVSREWPHTKLLCLEAVVSAKVRLLMLCAQGDFRFFGFFLGLWNLFLLPCSAVRQFTASSCLEQSIISKLGSQIKGEV